MSGFQRSISGAHIQLYVNGTRYNEVQQVNYTIDYGEKATYGVDSVFPQELHTTRIAVEGQIAGLRLKLSGGLQGINARPQIFDALNAPYISIRIFDRTTQEDIIYIPQAKVKQEAKTMVAKNTVKINFTFSGIQPLNPLDRV